VRNYKPFEGIVPKFSEENCKATQGSLYYCWYSNYRPLGYKAGMVGDWYIVVFGIKFVYWVLYGCFTALSFKQWRG